MKGGGTRRTIALEGLVGLITVLATWLSKGLSELCCESTTFALSGK